MTWPSLLRAARRALDLPDADVWLEPAFLDDDAARRHLDALRDEIDWRQEHVTVFGKRHPMPRLTRWHGDPGAVYTYSGVRREPAPWTPTLAALRERVEALVGVRFDSALANLYRDGDDAMGWHADDEPELGPEPVIASVSLGAERAFRLRHRTRKEVPPVTLTLPHGSLLVMSGPTQRCWEHSVPRRRRVRDARVNVTFRWVGGA